MSTKWQPPIEPAIMSTFMCTLALKLHFIVSCTCSMDIINCACGRNFDGCLI